MPEPEPEPLYQPLRPAKVRVASGTLKASYSSPLSEKRGDNNIQHVPPFLFESRSSSSLVQALSVSWKSSLLVH